MLSTDPDFERFKEGVELEGATRTDRFNFEFLFIIDSLFDDEILVISFLSPRLFILLLDVFFMYPGTLDDFWDVFGEVAEFVTGDAVVEGEVVDEGLTTTDELTELAVNVLVVEEFIFESVMTSLLILSKLSCHISSLDVSCPLSIEDDVESRTHSLFVSFFLAFSCTRTANSVHDSVLCFLTSNSENPELTVIILVPWVFLRFSVSIPCRWSSISFLIFKISDFLNIIGVQ